MTVSRREIILAGATLPAAVALSAPAFGQRPAGQLASEDPLFAPCLLIGGRKQIENCTYALGKLRSDEAKAFAKAEIEEHETIKKNLKALGYDYPVTRADAAAAGTTGGVTPAAAQASYRVAAGAAPVPPEAAGMIVIDHEVADQCVANYRKEFDEHAAKKHADKFFVGHQLVTHMTLLDQAQTFQRHASPKMQPVLAEGLKIIETHIATLKKLKEGMEGRASDQK